MAASLLDAQSVCYSAGLGDDGTFDVELAGMTGCRVIALDPTPAGMEHGPRLEAAVPTLTFMPVGLAGEDGRRTFYPPADPQHASYSIDNLQGTAEPVEAECLTVASVRARLGHDRLDLLKLDIEGSEYEVIDSLLRDGLLPRTLCVEFHRRDDPGEPRRYVERLRQTYDLVALEGWDLTFVRR